MANRPCARTGTNRTRDRVGKQPDKGVICPTAPTNSHRCHVAAMLCGVCCSDVYLSKFPCLQEGGNGRGSRGSSSSGRAGSRERTSRNIISSDSARVSHGGAPVEDGGAPIVVDGLFSSKNTDSAGGGVELGGGGYSRRKTAPEPPPYDDDDTAKTRESSFSANARSAAPAYTVPKKNGNGHRAEAGAEPRVVLEEPVYLVTDQYPYTYHQFDRQDEDRLLVSKTCSRRASLFSLQRHDGVETEFTKNTRRSRNQAFPSVSMKRTPRLLA